MTFLVDTNICIGVLNDRSAALTARWRTMRASQIRLCSVVKAELWFGAMKSDKRERVEQALIVFFARFRSMPFDDRAAVTYGELRATLESQGAPIGPNDLLIAAIAKANDLVLVTHNTREFSRIAELALEDWGRGVHDEGRERVSRRSYFSAVCSIKLAAPSRRAASS